MRMQSVDLDLIDIACSRARDQLSEHDAEQAERFIRQYFRWAAPEDLAEHGPLDVYGLALSHFNLARERAPGTTKVHVYNPQFDAHGWQSTHTAVEIVTDDMPFLIDSVGMELNRRGFGVHLIIHPVLVVRRDENGLLLEVLQPGSENGGDTITESVIHAEVERQTDPGELAALREHLLRVIGEVRAAVEDWQAMRERTLEIVADLEQSPPPLSAGEIDDAKWFLRWLADDNFTFLGYREYEVTEEEGEVRLAATDGSGLGILRQTGGDESSRSFDKLPPGVRAKALEPYLLNLTKANSRATIHRSAYLDYVGVKRFDAGGRVVGERRLLGLYTHTAYRARPGEIPILRRKVQEVLARASFPPGSHNEKALLEILETHPRDELFQTSVDELFEVAMGILHLGERQRMRLFVREDTFERSVSCLVFVPRDRFNTENRRRIERILKHAFRATSIDYTTRVSESVLVRLHYLVYTEEGRIPDYDAREIEMRLVAATRSWSDDLEDALIGEHGEEKGNAMLRQWGEAFPAAYRADWVPRSALADIGHGESLGTEGDLDISLYRPLEAGPRVLRAKVYRAGPPLALSDLLPQFENMGVRVGDERPYQVTPADGPPFWIYDFGLTYGGEDELEADQVRQSFQDAFLRAWRGDVEDDGYNRLVLRARLSWREISILRAIGRYLRQGGSTFSDHYIEQALVAHPRIAQLLVELIRNRFDPSRADAIGAEAAVGRIERAIDAVESLDQDQILRTFLSVVQAMLRTNFFQRDDDGRPKVHVAFKLDSSSLSWLPQPRPRFEIFVYSPRTEGVHLRGGEVARGGIRWSDRREDFRTEVLGLMKAQMVKNAVIVPVGAKGGFVLKRPPAGDRDALLAEVEACYRTFIGGLLDLTDNIEGGELAPPVDVVRYDEDDPYLVVAADKGTATLSDVANSISTDRGFWLGDAFASGGSTGYDHKAMGITARGAWESVKRHFRELGLDIQSQEFTVVGIGDMSGDVFGNGMLLSPHIRLVGAFNHRHVFIDPDPDAARSFEERKRLFELAGSSWDDYDPELISEGGGVYPRTAKSIPLSPQAREALGVEAESLRPADVIRALLRAPVDLLWNGGIGTYVKASFELHSDAGDKSNDAVRVDASELRCHVVGEGGNLGFTQRARIEYAAAGGRINTDGIDNSGGVDCSDREVNIKVLLNGVVADGDLTAKQRNELLAEMSEPVAELVLKDNYEQAETLSLAEAQATSMLDVHRRFMRRLEQGRRLDRELEALPDDEEIAERRREHRGLTRPELATLMAYSKVSLYAELLDSSVPEDPYLSAELDRYFPAPLPERFGDRMRDHRLRREITATQVVNNMLHGGGTTFAFRLHEETGAPAAEIARAYAVMREVFQMRPQWAEIEGLDNRVAADVQAAMLLEGRRLIERGSRWLLRHRPRPLAIAPAVETFAAGAEALYDSIPRLIGSPGDEPLLRRAAELEEAGVPARLAGRVSCLGIMFSTLDIVEVATDAGLDVTEVARVHFRVGSVLQLHWLLGHILALSRDDRWQALARAALRDDLHSLHRALTAEVLRSGAGSDVEAWVERNPAAERCLQTLGDIRGGGSFDLTTLPVAVREVRNLLQAAD